MAGRARFCGSPRRSARPLTQRLCKYSSIDEGIDARADTSDLVYRGNEWPEHLVIDFIIGYGILQGQIRRPS
jgi:hypothetical protein